MRIVVKQLEIPLEEDRQGLFVAFAEFGEELPRQFVLLRQPRFVEIPRLADDVYFLIIILPSVNASSVRASSNVTGTNIPFCGSI